MPDPGYYWVLFEDSDKYEPALLDDSPNEKNRRWLRIMAEGAYHPYEAVRIGRRLMPPQVIEQGDWPEVEDARQLMPLVQECTNALIPIVNDEPCPGDFTVTLRAKRTGGKTLVDANITIPSRRSKRAG